MKRKEYKRILLITIVICIISVLFYLYLPPKVDLVKKMNYTVESGVDVLCVGSSHMYNGINPIQLYKDRGIASYIIAGGSQSPWQSFYYIKQGCKQHKPYLIIYDTYIMGTVQDMGYYQDYQTASNMLNTPISVDKIDTILNSEADSKLDLILRFPYIYDDLEAYPGLSRKKLIPGDKNLTMGYKYQSGIEKYEDIIEVENITESRAIHPKNEKYLRDIIEWCRNNEIELLLTNTPWPCINEENEMYFNSIENIADEYGVPFINGCKKYKEIGIDYTTDSYGDGGHLNYSGVTKYTKYIGDYLSQNYHIIDRRGDSHYSIYEQGVAWCDENYR